ncbi:MAG: FkbM family methyltransferase [Crocinitomicaceae bacterium]|nr:FkbM family methyltransferase [Crocinitomicaceae bacterium]
MIRKGKMKEKYAELYFVEKIVNPGDVILDIGANLGYYSYFMARKMGQSGKLLAVEPIPLFAEVWTSNLKPFKSFDITLFNCALGNEAQEKVKMSIPVVNGVVRHGLTRVVEEDNVPGESLISFEVPMKVGDDLIQEKALSKLDYIKCDVEGYEQYVIPSLDKTIDQFKPLFQIELGGEENRRNVVNYLLKKGYNIHILDGDFLIPIQKNDIFSLNQDFYFIHGDKMAKSQHLIRK